MADGDSDSRGEALQSFYAKQQVIDSARTVFQQLSAVLRNAGLYPAAHPILQIAADALRSKIEDLLVGRQEAPFYMVSGELFFEKISVPVDQSLAPVMEQFSVRKVGGVIFRTGISPQELIRFASLMNREPGLIAETKDLTGLLVQEEIANIELSRVLLVDKETAADVKAGARKASELFHEALNAVKDMVQAVHKGRTYRMRKMNATIQSMVDSILEDRDAFLGLTNIRMYDEYTYAHSVNTSVLAVSLGTFLSFQKPQVAALGVAGMLHDIGKLHVPHEVINKPGKLTDEEWQQVKRHPVEGALLLADIPGVSKLAMVAAFEHHQHRNIPGYPEIEGESKLHPFSEIIKLADAYEAMTAARVYYNARMPPDQAVRTLLQKRNKPFDPVLVKAFVNMVGFFPIGTLLKLDTGETGMVVHQTTDLLRPRVLLLTAFDGSERGRPDVSLLETAGGRYLRSVAGTIDAPAARIDLRKYLE